VTITAAVLAFSLFRLLQAARITRRPLGMLENNALTTVSSGAGYMTGGGNMAAYGALLMVIAAAGPGAYAMPGAGAMMVWFGAIAALGVFTAIPIKRQLINKENLAFPTGTATATTLQALHGEAKGGGTGQAKALGWAALFAAVLTWFRDAKAAWMPFNVPNPVPFPGWFSIAGRSAIDWTLALKTEVVLIGAGALMSFRTGWSLLLGGLLTYGWLAPALVKQGEIAEVKYKSIVGWSVWPGAAILVVSALTSFVLDWRSVARSFSGLASLFGGRRREDPMDAVECPGWWFPVGYLVLGPVVVVLMTLLFQIPLWAGLVALPLAIVMGFVASRVTGETDVTPTKALGPVTQCIYGGLARGNLPGNIMAANVTGGIGLHAADLLTTIKTGWLLGGSPRVQFWAQLVGVAAGAAVVVPAFNVLIPDHRLLGTDEWPAPSCVVWEGVSKAFAGELGSLRPSAVTGIVFGGLLGAVLAVLERFASRRLKAFVPSASGLGIAMVVPGSNAIAMFLGALGAWLLNRYRPAFAQRTVVPVASGFIAGESLMGVAIALLIIAGVLTR
jgi:uncharacterized oligopeptide transporter (OPT) family protein